MPPRVLLWTAMLADGPVGRSADKHREDILSKVRRHILPPIQISRQYPPEIEIGLWLIVALCVTGVSVALEENELA